jgi:uncharacterized protein
MEKRKLGNTGVTVGPVGLGLEYLEKAPTETVVSVMHAAMDAGVDYYDLWMATPHIRDAVGAALKGRRDRAFLAGHIGSVLNGDVTDITRDPAAAERSFEDLLRRTGTDHVDAAMLFFVDKPDDYERVFGPNGTAELARRMRERGSARWIGMSSHYAPTALRAVRSGAIDILMFPVNPVFDLVSTDMRIEALWEPRTYEQAAAARETALQAKRELYAECARRGVALVAMKPFASGWLFNPGNPSGIVLTPAQCMHYALSQPGVSAAVPGCKSVEELRGALSWYQADAAGRDYSAIVSNGLWRLEGRCMYCDHCLPCPAGIDVGVVTRCIDRARAVRASDGPSAALPADLRAEYASLPAAAADCVECGDCVRKCPFSVDVVAAMREGRELFG